MYDVVGVGEVLIDFSPSAPGPMGNPGFEMNPGGAPANCLAANAKLGGNCAFIGCVGKDFFGEFLRAQLQGLQIDTRGLLEVPEHTTIDFVANGPGGERRFAFYRNPGADTRLEYGDIGGDWWLDTKIFHYGTLSFTDEPSASTVRRMREEARKRGVLVSFDPNYRENLWSSPLEARSVILEGLDCCDILKISEEEMSLIFGPERVSPPEAVERLLEKGIRYVFVTAGEKGAWYGAGDRKGHEAGFPVEAVDTTGCGDTFLGVIHYLLVHHPGQDMGTMVRYANAAAAVCATGRTGIVAMPAWDQIEKLMKGGGQDRKGA